MKAKKNIVVLISGYGSNLKAIIEYIKEKSLPINISAVISSNNNAYGLTIAKQYAIPAYVIDDADLSNKEYNHNLLQVVKSFSPDLIILAGFMRILTKQFITPYDNKILNIHPSLLPKYPGLNTHQRVLDNKEVEHGCTIHYVTTKLDDGPIIDQQKFLITPNDTAESLKLKVQKLEHEAYPKIIERLVV